MVCWSVAPTPPGHLNLKHRVFGPRMVATSLLPRLLWPFLFWDPTKEVHAPGRGGASAPSPGRPGEARAPCTPGLSSWGREAEGWGTSSGGRVGEKPSDGSLGRTGPLPRVPPARRASRPRCPPPAGQLQEGASLPAGPGPGPARTHSQRHGSHHLARWTLWLRSPWTPPSDSSH